MPSLQEVARSAGVSVSTASRVLNGTKLSERISAQCANRVRAAAERVGYVAGYHRRAIRTGRTETLGVALERNAPDPTKVLPSALIHPFHNLMIAGVEQATHGVGYNLSMIVPSEQQRANVRGVQQVREGRIDGLVLPPANTRPDNTQTLREAPDLPIAAILPAVATELPSVYHNYDAAIEMVVQHLARLGHRRLLYFGPLHRDGAPTYNDRERMFHQAVQNLDLAGDACLFDAAHQHVEGEMHQWDVVEQQMSALETCLHSRPRRFTAIVCFNDMAAISACRVLARHGLRVPTDVSLTGIDNVDPALTIPTLTTIDACLLDLGHRAAQIVLEMINGGDDVRRRYRGHREVISPRLFVRESTGPAPQVPTD